MRIEETFRLDAPRDTVFDFLSDGPRVAACVPGVEDFTEDEDGTYEAVLKAQVGPIKAMFKGRVTLETTPPGRLEATGRGQDRASGSRAEVAFTGELVEVDDGAATRVETVADVTIRGRLGQFGTGVIRATATEFIREFVACANDQLAHGATDTGRSDDGRDETGRDETGRDVGRDGDGRDDIGRDDTDPVQADAATSDGSAAPAGRRTGSAPTRRPTSQFRLLLRILLRMVRDAWQKLVQALRNRGSR